MLERAAHNHGGAAINIIHYIAVEHDGPFVNVDRAAAHERLDYDLVPVDHLHPVQRALDDLVRCALDFGTTSDNKLWTSGVNDYDITNISYNDKARASALLDAALDFAKAVGAARHQVSQP